MDSKEFRDRLAKFKREFYVNVVATSGKQIYSLVKHKHVAALQIEIEQEKYFFEGSGRFENALSFVQGFLIARKKHKMKERNIVEG